MGFSVVAAARPRELQALVVVGVQCRPQLAAVHRVRTGGLRVDVADALYKIVTFQGESYGCVAVTRSRTRPRTQRSTGTPPVSGPRNAHHPAGAHGTSLIELTGQVVESSLNRIATPMMVSSSESHSVAARR